MFRSRNVLVLALCVALVAPIGLTPASATHTPTHVAGDICPPGSEGDSSATPRTIETRVHYGPRYVDSGGNVDFRVVVYHNATAGQGCTITNTYLHLQIPGGGSSRTSAQQGASGFKSLPPNGKAEFRIPDFSPGQQEGVKVVQVYVRRAAGGTTANTNTDTFINGVGPDNIPPSVKLVVGLRPELVVMDGPAGRTMSDGSPFRGVVFEKAGVTRANDALKTDYTSSDYTLHVRIRNFGPVGLANPNTLADNGQVCTGPAAPHASCTAQSTGVPLRLLFNFTRRAQGDDEPDSGGNEIRVDRTVTARLFHQADSRCAGPTPSSLCVLDVSFAQAEYGVDMRRAGDWNLTVIVDPAPHQVIKPETENPKAHWYQRAFESGTRIKGANLIPEGITFKVEDSFNTLSCGDSAANACPRNVFITVDGRFRNDGEEVNAGGPNGALGGVNVKWRWEGDLNLLRPEDAAQNTPSEQCKPSPSPACVLAPGEQSIPLTTGKRAPTKEGVITVRLIPDVDDVVIETHEADTVGIATIYITDLSPPVFRNVIIPGLYDTNNETEAVADVREGRPFKIEAHVEENGGLAAVTGVVTTGSGNYTQNVTFTDAERSIGTDDPLVWEATLDVDGVVGPVTMALKAVDTGGLAAWTNYTFNVVPFERRVRNPIAELNGKTGTADNDEAPWTGDYDQRTNFVYIEADIDRTGRPVASTEGKWVRIEGPDGEEIEGSPFAMKGRLACERDVAGNREVARGPACEDDPFVDPASLRTIFFVDSRAELDEEPAHDFDLPGIGNYTATLVIEDANGRNDTRPSDELVFWLQDNPPGPEGRPQFTSPPTIDKTSVEPGGSVKVAAGVSDQLHVELVELLARHRLSGHEYNVSIPLKTPGTGTTDAKTGNGTYELTFLVGAGKDLPRGGTYDVRVRATDFARRNTTAELDELTVVDATKPIVTVRVDPGAEQEAGDRIEWLVTVTDATETRAPVLIVRRPGAPAESHVMEFNTTRSAFVHREQTSLSELGTWGWDVRVSDHAGNEELATGTVEVVQNLPPRARSWKPDAVGLDGKTYGPPRPVVEVEIIDTNTGVDQSSIRFTIDGTPVTGNPRPVVENGRTIGYTLSHALDGPLPHGKVVVATVRAKDQTEGGGLESLALQHEFVIDAVRPAIDWRGEPSRRVQDETVIGTPTLVSVTVTDADSGPATASIEVARLAGERVEARHRFDYTAPFKVSDITQVFAGRGEYRLVVEAADRVGNDGERIQRFLAFDDASPLIVLLPPNPGQQRENVRANITDEGGVAHASVEYFTSNAAPREIPMNLTAGVWTATIPPFAKNTTVSFRIKATDIFGNAGASEVDSFSASNQPPTVRVTEPASGARISGRTLVKWEATDTDTPAGNLRMTVLWARPGEPFRAFTGAQSLRNTGSFVLDTTSLPNGRVILRVLAGDDASFGQDQVEVLVSNLGSIFVDPLVDPAKVRAGDTVLVSVKITQAVADPRALLKDPDGRVVVNATLKDDGQDGDQAPNDGLYAARFQAPEAGAYTLELYAATAEGPAVRPDVATLVVDKAREGGWWPIPEFGLLTLLVGVGVALGLVGMRRRFR